MKHFYLVQQLANIYQAQVIQVFGLVVHGKGEVGRTAKVAVRWKIAAGKVLLGCDNIIDFLKDNFVPSKQTHILNEFTEQNLI